MRTAKILFYVWIFVAFMVYCTGLAYVGGLLLP